jgi:hypothetical protein
MLHCRHQLIKALRQELLDKIPPTLAHNKFTSMATMTLTAVSKYRDSSLVAAVQLDRTRLGKPQCTFSWHAEAAKQLHLAARLKSW